MRKTVFHLPEKEIRKEGWKALVKRLGVAGATRFLLEYQAGKSNYVKERKKLFLGKTVRELGEEILKEK